MDTTAPESQFVTVAAAAETLSISETTVRRLIGAGLLPAVRVSPGALRIERDELAGWISERRTASSTVGGGSSAEAVGHGSSVDAGAFLSSRPQTPAAHVRDPDPAGSRSRPCSAGAER